MRIRILPLLAGVAPWAAGPLRAQELPQDPATTLVVETPGYAFHVDFWANLHDWLYWRAQDDGPSDDEETCIAGRPEAERADWRAVEAYYRTDMKDRHWRGDPVMRALRYTLSGTAPYADSLVAPMYARLRRAAPTYRACFWERHRRLARERLADVLPPLLVHGPRLKERLAGYYGAPWPARIHVDVVPYASFAGANTASGPDVPPHMQISSIDPDLAGLSGLELLLHEASHEIFGPGRGLVGEAIDRASASLAVEPPRDLWHAVSFFTSGYVMRQMAEGAGLEYATYGSRGLFQRAWPEYIGPLEVHWTPYLEGRASVDEAMREVVSAISGRQER